MDNSLYDDMGRKKKQENSKRKKVSKYSGHTSTLIAKPIYMKRFCSVLGRRIVLRVLQP